MSEARRNRRKMMRYIKKMVKKQDIETIRKVDDAMQRAEDQKNNLQ